MHRLSDPAAAPAAPIVTPVPADVPAALAAITKALGLPDGADADTIRAALEACLAVAGESAPAAIEAASLRAGLSQREARMLSTMRGYTVTKVADYVEAKRRMAAAQPKARAR